MVKERFVKTGKKKIGTRSEYLVWGAEKVGGGEKKSERRKQKQSKAKQASLRQVSSSMATTEQNSEIGRAHV